MAPLLHAAARVGRALQTGRPSGFFAVMLSAQAAKGAAQLQSETTYTVVADPYLPIQVIEPAH
jgi:hypothetical protein